MHSTEVGRIGIVGLGHIGASLAGRLVARDQSVSGLDRDPDALEVAAARFGVRRCSGLRALAAASDLVVVACPTPQVPTVLEELAGVGFEGTVVEVASVKSAIFAARERLGFERLISLHPMAGRELGGAASADPGIFDGARWAIVLAGDEPEEAIEEAVRLVTEQVGNELLGLEATTHDRIMAVITGLPHVGAILLARALERLPEAVVAAELAAGSLRDGVRVARTPPERLVELLVPNADDLASQVAELLADGAALGSILDSREELLRFVAPATAGAARVVRRAPTTRHVVIDEGTLAGALVELGRQGLCLQALAHVGARLTLTVVGSAPER